MRLTYLIFSDAFVIIFFGRQKARPNNIPFIRNLNYSEEIKYVQERVYRIGL